MAIPTNGSKVRRARPVRLASRGAPHGRRMRPTANICHVIEEQLRIRTRDEESPPPLGRRQHSCFVARWSRARATHGRIIGNLVDKPIDVG